MTLYPELVGYHSTQGGEWVARYHFPVKKAAYFACLDVGVYTTRRGAKKAFERVAAELGCKVEWKKEAK